MRKEPVVIGFCCNECAYAAADLAGSIRRSYPYNVRIIRVPCSGYVDPIYIVRAFQLGADGVFVGGCLEGTCHYIDGNIKARKRVEFLKRTLDAIGLGGDRLELFLVSAADADAFVDYVKGFTERVLKLVRNPLKGEAGLYSIEVRRRVLSEILADIIGKLGLPSKTLDRCLEDAPDSLGEIDINTEKCIGCEACINVCEYDSLKIKYVDGNARILYNSRECRLCGECIDACIKDAISYIDSLNLKSFIMGSDYEKVRLKLVKCILCGRYYIPEKQYVEIEFPDIEVYRYCPECRKKILADRLSRCPLV